MLREDSDSAGMRAFPSFARSSSSYLTLLLSTISQPFPYLTAPQCQQQTNTAEPSYRASITSFLPFFGSSLPSLPCSTPLLLLPPPQPPPPRHPRPPLRVSRAAIDRRSARRRSLAQKSHPSACELTGKEKRVLAQSASRQRALWACGGLVSSYPPTITSFLFTWRPLELTQAQAMSEQRSI